MSEAQDHIGQKVMVEGLPSLVRREGFLIRDGINEFYVERDFFGSGFYGGDYDSARQALEIEARDSDEEKVKVYGVLKENNTIKARFVDVEGTLYEIYK